MRPRFASSSSPGMEFGSVSLLISSGAYSAGPQSTWARTALSCRRKSINELQMKEVVSLEMSQLRGLILAPYGRDADFLSVRLAECGGEPVVCLGLHELLDQLRAGGADLLVISDD